NDPIHVRAKTNVEIPLVSHGKRVYPTGDGMLREALHVRLPDRIGGKLGFIVTSNPVEEFRPPLVFWNLDCVVNTNQPYAFLDQITDDLEMVVLNDRVIVTPVHIKQNGVRLIKGCRVARPAMRMETCRHAWNLVKALLQQ